MTSQAKVENSRKASSDLMKPAAVVLRLTMGSTPSLHSFALFTMMFRSIVLLLVLTCSSTSAFTVAPPPQSVACQQQPLFSEPSDTSSDSDVLTVESQPYTPTSSEALVTSVLDQLPSLLSDDVPSEMRSKITESLLRLESMNPTSDGAASPLLNGIWELKYVAGYSPDWALASPTRDLALFLYSGGYSPGLFALSLAQKLPFVQVGDLEISISRQQPRIEASLSVTAFGSESTVVVKAGLEALSGVRLQETYESATVLDQKVELPVQVQYSRDLFITYLDEDLLIVRDSSGVPEVLVRKSYRNKWGTEPSALDDMVPPGSDDDEQLPATD